MLAINTSTSESTGYSPAFLTQGRNPRLPKALYDEVTMGTGARCLGPEERSDELQDIFKIVRNNLEKASQKQRHYYNLRRRNWTPEIGDHVLVRQHPLSKAIDSFAAKLAPKFKGPYVITEFVSPVIVQLRAVGNNETRTAHISELKQYLSNNHSFSLILSRYPKSIVERHGESMEADKQRFEKARQKIRHSMQREEKKVRRTIFLADDEVPGTSKSGTQKRGRTTRKSPETQPTTTNSEKPKVRNLRMTVVNPPSHKLDQTSEAKTVVSEERERCSVEIIDISEDEEVPPPPPIINTSAAQIYPGEELDEPPPPPIWEDEGFSIEDLGFDEDLNDPFIVEFCRSFWGLSDTTVNRRTTTPPSPPPSSSSSIDWESENFHPPTPPRRRGFGSLETQDRQYNHLGMQCYERIWRARILIPSVTPQMAVTDNIHQGLKESIQRYPASSPNRSNSSPFSTPMTPGRGWLDPCGYDHNEVDNDPPQPPSSSMRPHNETPIPSSPPMHLRQTSIPTPPDLARQTLPHHPAFEQLPWDVQQELARRREQNKGTRKRFRIEIWGQPYRVSISHDGSIGITRI